MIFQLAGGANLPLTADNIAVDILGETAGKFDAEFVQHAATAVFHYFKHDLDRQSVTIAEFAEAMEKVLRGFRLPEEADDCPLSRVTPRIAEFDLWHLARESGDFAELFFFPRLREELRRHLRENPRVIRFKQLRSCVKELVGTRRWNVRCRTLEEEIVRFLRECLTAEQRQEDFALVVE